MKIKRKSKRIVELNNKGRKGRYIYIYKDGKGRYTKEKEVIKTAKKQVKRSLRIARGSRKISKTFKKGITRAFIDIHKAGNAEIKEAYTRLFKPLIKDRDLLDFVIENIGQNSGKLRDRFRHDVTLKGTDTQTGTTTTRKWTVFGETIEEMIRKHRRDDLRKGAIISSDKLNMILDEMKVPAETRTSTFATGNPYAIEEMTAVCIFVKGR